MTAINFKLYQLDSFPFAYLETLLDRSPRLTESKVGVRIAVDKKIRQDYFLTTPECGAVDEFIFDSFRQQIEADFGVSLRFRERYKIGFYEGSKRGFYNPHRDSWGHPNRTLSMVMCLSPREDYEGGLFRFTELNEEFKFDKGQAIVFRPELLHGVEPVTCGTRKVLISFLYDVEGGLKKYHLTGSFNGFDPQVSWSGHTSTEDLLKSHRVVPQESPVKSTEFPSDRERSIEAEHKSFLTVLTPDSGPGNQVMAVKEAWVLSRILGRKLLCPPIRQHYTEGGSLFWPLDELFELGGGDVDALSMSDFARLYSADKNDDSARLLLHTNYERALKIEEAMGVAAPHQLAEPRRFRSLDSLKRLKAIDSEILSLKHVFNTIFLSECGWNGAYDSPMNSEFLEVYRGVCRDFDFSKSIREEALRFLTEAGIQTDFAALHLRYPDQMLGKPLVEHAGYSEDEILEYIVNFTENGPLPANRIFIATNKPEMAKNSALVGCVFYDPSCSKFASIASFIEQCICSRASLFFMSPYNDYSNKDKPHQRSTWSSFVQDHRRFTQGLHEDGNVLLFHGSQYPSRMN